MENFQELSEKQQKELIAITAAQNSLIDFSIVVNKKYQVTWYLEQIAEMLEKAYFNILKRKRTRIILEVPPRHGKHLANDTPILTTTGWKKHGDLQIGDYVFGGSGKPVKVNYISEEKLCNYKIQFSDGSVFYTHSNHKWIVYDRKKRGKKQILETEEIAKHNLSLEGEKNKRGHRYRFQVDYNKLIIFKKKELKVHPYILGVWLGDGKRDGGTICVHPTDKAIIEKIIKLGGNVSSQWKHKTTGVNYYYLSGLYSVLRKIYKLENKKFIPKDYLFSSKEDRLELLAGLVDTDGHKDKKGRYRISTCDKELAENIRELVTGLGSYAYIIKILPTTSSSGIIGRKIVYQVGFNLNFKLPVTLERKKNTGIFTRRKRSIISLEKIQSNKKGKCIQVEGGNYLVGKNFIPTHNTTISTIHFPAWVLGKSPDIPIIIVSYSQDKANDYGLETRDLMNNKNYQTIFKTRLRADTQSKSRWITEGKGSYTAVGIGGSISGRGFLLGIIDDPIKNREEADSKLIRDRNWKWYRSTFLTREDGNGAIIVISTRYHDDDLIGRITKSKGGDEWEKIKFPAIAEQDEKFRKKGEPLWKDRFSLKTLEKRKRDIGSIEFSSLFQQNPIDVETQEFKKSWIKYRDWNEVKKLNTRRFVTIDPAAAMKDKSDYIGITINYVDKENNWNLKAFRTKMNALNLINFIFKIYEETNFEKIGIEQGSYQSVIQPFLEQEMKKRSKFFQVVELKHNQRNKHLRIRGLIPRYSSGSIFHIKNECDDLEEEMLRFPKGANDDVIDSCAYQISLADAPLSEGKIEQFKERVFDPYY